MRKLISAFVVVLALTFATVVYAAEVTLEWDANAEEDLAGYRIFCRQAGQDYNYKVPAWEGTETTCTISELVGGIDYYFVARAFDKSGNESDNSNEVDTGPPKAPCLLRWLR